MLSLLSKERMRTSRNLLIAGAIAVAACALSAAYQTDYLSIIINKTPPMELTSTQIGDSNTRVSVNEGKYMYVSFQGEDVLETVIEEKVRRRRSGSSTYYYHLVTLGDQVIMVRTSTPFLDRGSYEGVLKKNDIEIAGLVNSSDTEGRELLPYYLHKDGHTPFFAYLLLIASIFALGTAIWGILRYARPESHHLTKAVRDMNFENAAPLDQGRVLAVGSFILTPDLLLKKNMFSTAVVKMREVTWAYMETKKKKAYFVIPVGTKAFLILETPEKKYRFEGSMKDIDAALLYMHEAHPEIKIGFEEPALEEEEYS